MPINVTKTFLPPFEEFQEELASVWASAWVTNHGPLVGRLEAELRRRFDVEHLYLVANGTLGIQIAIEALALRGTVVTTPFSYVATTSTLVWQGIRPVFADISPETLTIDPESVRSRITKDTTGIVATHVYGIPCDSEALEAIAEDHGIPVLYDAAHCFDVAVGGRSVVGFGDVSVMSFHATKVFHTIEGGAVVTSDGELAARIEYMRNFGHHGEEAFWGLGINAKMAEVNAAMGLCNLRHMAEIREARRNLTELYRTLLEPLPVRVIRPAPDVAEAYGYVPILLADEDELLRVRGALRAQEIYPRRYFYPSLEKLPYMADREHDVPVADDVSRRVLCLPLHHELETDAVRLVCRTVEEALT